MNQDIQLSLDRLKIELNKLLPAVHHIDTAEKAATSAVNSALMIHEQYEKHLLSLEKLLVASNQDQFNQIAKELDISSSKLSNLGLAISKSFAGLENELSTFIAHHKLLAIEAVNLTAKIEGIDFPQRLERIEKSINYTTTIFEDTREATLEKLQRASEKIIKADFDGGFKKLQTSVGSAVSSNQELYDLIEEQNIGESIFNFKNEITKKLESSIAEFHHFTREQQTKITKLINDLNIPVRFEKLEKINSSINQEKRLTEQIIEVLQSRVKTEMLSSQNVIISKTEKLERKIEQSIASLILRINADMISFQEGLISRAEKLENKFEPRIGQIEYEFAKTFETINKENKLLKILLIVSIGLSVLLVVLKNI